MLRFRREERRRKQALDLAGVPFSLWGSHCRVGLADLPHRRPSGVAGGPETPARPARSCCATSPTPLSGSRSSFRPSWMPADEPEGRLPSSKVSSRATNSGSFFPTNAAISSAGIGLSAETIADRPHHRT